VLTPRLRQSRAQARFYNVTTAAGERWSVPLPASGSVQPIAALQSSAHRTFDVDVKLCEDSATVAAANSADVSASYASAKNDDGHCCGYFDPAASNLLRVQRLSVPCRDLIFRGDVCTAAPHRTLCASSLRVPSHARHAPHDAQTASSTRASTLASSTRRRAAL
jgi:hypothetical protein